MKAKAHLGCLNYVPVDAFKGLCHLDKSLKSADGPACDKSEPAPECGHCRNYTPEEEFLGKCKNTHKVYPGLSARTCEDFGWKK